MDEIDAQLRQRDVQIHARMMCAVMEYSQRFKLEVPMSSKNNVGTPGNYSDANVAAHIRTWFELRYGDRLKVFMGPGTTVLLIRGDPWEMRLPMIRGQVKCVVERNLKKYSNDFSIGVRGQCPVVNILSLVRDLPQGLATQLTDSECWDVMNTFREALDCTHAVEDLSDKPYISEVRGDIAASVGHIFSRPPHYGQSKWASCQAVEKLLKCILKMRDIPFPKTHDLVKLANLARQQGANIDSTEIARVSAAAGVRYGEVRVSLTEAVNAHYASLITARQVYAAFDAKG